MHEINDASRITIRLLHFAASAYVADNSQTPQAARMRHSHSVDEANGDAFVFAMVSMGQAASRSKIFIIQGNQAWQVPAF
jgi:hypothetical protein